MTHILSVKLNNNGDDNNYIADVVAVIDNCRIECKLIRIWVRQRKYRYFVETADGCRVRIDGRSLPRCSMSIETNQ